MANAVRGEVSFEAAGTTYRMKISTNALCEIEDALGESIDEVGRKIAENKSAKIRVLRTLVWGALLDRHPNLTPKDAGRLIDEIGMEKASELIAKCFELMQPEASGNENPPQATAGE